MKITITTLLLLSALQSASGQESQGEITNSPDGIHIIPKLRVGPSGSGTGNLDYYLWHDDSETEPSNGVPIKPDISGTYSTAIAPYGRAESYASFAFGWGAWVDELSSTTTPNYNDSPYSYAIGQRAAVRRVSSSMALGSFAYAGKLEDNNPTIDMGHMYAFGTRAKATGSSAMAIGYNSHASGTSAYTFGQGTKASGSNSYAIGYDSNSLGTSSYTLGEDATANGNFSYAIGYAAKTGYLNSVTNANYPSHNSAAFGMRAQTGAHDSLALGIDSLAGSFRVTAIGSFPKYKGTESRTTPVPGDPLFIIANGTGFVDNPGTPSVVEKPHNSLRVLKDDTILIWPKGDIDMDFTEGEDPNGQ